MTDDEDNYRQCCMICTSKDSQFSARTDGVKMSLYCTLVVKLQKSLQRLQV